VLHEQHKTAHARIRQITARLRRTARRRADDMQAEVDRLSEESLFATAAAAMQADGAVVWITGWLPADQEDELRGAARENAWGLLIRDPQEDETPPTLLRPPRLFRPVLALFKGLDISPAYTEADVSVPFFCFFAIFFAMLVGDGGYGALLLAATFYVRRKLPKAPRTPFILMTCFSVGTIIWGTLSNTWFGTHPGFADNVTSRWLNHPEDGINNMMLLCFTLGVVHLSIARLWNFVVLFPDTKALAELGWVGVLAFMYCMSCSIVGIFKAPAFIYPVFAVSLVLIFLFTLKRNELKTNGIELGMLPLNIVSALGDIISYVRLFAVGLASVKVAENFNSMAVNLGLPLWAKILPLILILLLGHGLNLAMAGLSILVHAVRLNTLEFSNHKGITWSGYVFKPFKRL
jgi:V/A-type H+-transporting ATPase subunit I